MKSLADLQKLRDEAKRKIELREDKENAYRIVVGMATCGIAAGARPVLNALVDEVARLGLDNVVVSQTGCIGMCTLEPIVEIYNPSNEKTTYIKVDAKRAVEIIDNHILKGNIVKEYTVASEK